MADLNEKPKVVVRVNDGPKKIVVGKRSNSKPIKSNQKSIKTIVKDDLDIRPDPMIGDAGLNPTRKPYSRGGKIHVRKREK